MGEKFYLDFKSDGSGKVEIEEPKGYSTSSFELKQKPNGYARDLFFGGGDNEFELSSRLKHHLDKILYFNHRYGFESKVDFIIEKSGIENIMGEIDFATATTDDLEYFKFKVIQNGDYQILNRRMETDVDLTSSLNIDKEVIEPIVPQKMLLLNKPTFESSEWNNPQNITIGSNEIVYFENQINIARNIIKSDLSDNFIPFSNVYESVSGGNENKIITLKDNAKGITFKLKNLKANILGGFGGRFCRVYLSYGKEFNLAKTIDLFYRTLLVEDIYIDLSDKEYLIGDLNRGDSIWLNCRLYHFKNRDDFNDNPTMFLEKSDFEISATTYSYNSICPSFRLFDVMQQVVKSPSGLDIVAPQFDYGGQFWNDRLINGNYLRGIDTRGFKVSLKNLSDSLMEMNADYEIQPDGRVFFGLEKEFYTDYECGFFDKVQFHSMNKMPNPRFTVNEMTYKYKRYQSLKEKEELNSADVIHGEKKLTFFNKRVENKKSIEIEWGRDAFDLDTNRRKGLEVSESSSSQDDNNLFAIVSVDTEQDIEFKETTELQHTFISETVLSLKTKGEVNFKSLGMGVGSVFKIKAPDNNAREYRVKTIGVSEITLEVFSGGNVYSSNDGIRITDYSYTISKEEVPFTNMTNQDVTAFGLNASESYSNLIRSIGQNLYNFYKEQIATINIYHKDKVVVNTEYKNNPKCKIVYQGRTIEEGGDFITTDIKPILTPFLYNDIIFSKVRFEDFMALANEIRTKRGYIRCLNKLNRVIRFYAVDVKWEISNEQLTIKGEEKFESEYMTINTENNFVIINDEVRITYFKYEIKKEFVYLYDMNRKLLFNPVYWDMVSVNGAKSITSNELDKTLKLISKNEI